ncbi:hypothetical protein [Pseudoduganella sp.]|uniref:hypothetical protein n=1 Tax=Pseudoduganella sp. TaxID=1880898 RepID=UPI0035B40B38
MIEWSSSPESRIQALEEENRRLRREVEFLRGHPTIARGLRGESLVATLASARFSRSGSGHDLELRGAELLIEVKYSSLLRVVDDRALRRWAWTKLFGELGNKRYDRLLLVGDADPRFAGHYADPTSPYVFFDLPYDAVVAMAGGIKRGRAGVIHLTSNPTSVRSARARALFCRFQVSADEVTYRYGLVTPSETRL